MEGFIEKEQDKRQEGRTRNGIGKETEKDMDQSEVPLREQLASNFTPGLNEWHFNSLSIPNIQVKADS